MSRALEEYKDIYDKYLKQQRDALTASYWHTREYRLKFDGKKEDFVHIQNTAESVLEGLEILISTLEGERDKPGVQVYINHIKSTIDLHLAKVSKYFDKNPPKGFKTKEDTRAEHKFQRLVFKGQENIKTKLRKLDISNSMNSFEFEFHGKKLASLVFKTSVENFSSEIRAKIETLDIDWDYMDDQRFFITIPKREIPDWNDSKHFWEQEKDVLQFYVGEFNKIKKGFYIGDYFVHPWLYFHINFFKTNIPCLNDRGVIEEVVKNVDFRRNEWYFAEILKKAEELNRGAIFIYGSRRIGKSVLEASKLAHKSLISNNCELAVTINNDEDRISITDKIKTCYNNLPSFLKIETNIDNWSKLVELGLKTSLNRKIKHCNIRVTNLDSGSKAASQKGAGGAPVEYIFDESGKANFVDAYNAAKYSFKTPLGWKTIPIFVGCVVAGTKVWTNNGELKNIEDLKKQDGIIGHNGKNITKEPITYQQKPLNKECLEITTVGGHKIECSIDHPFLTSDPKKRMSKNVRKTSFQEAQNLKKGDYIFKPNQINIFGNEKLENSRLLGLLIGDGYYAGNSISLSLAEEELYKFIKNEYKTTIKKKFITKKGNIYREVNVLGLSPWKKALGIKNDSKCGKKIPSILYKTSEKNICDFLAGYFDADGTVSINKKGRISIKLTSNCKHLLLDSQNLLHKLGIQSNILKLKRDKTKLSEEYQGSQDHKFVLDISRHKDIVKFSEKIYLIINEKRERIEKYVKTTKVNRDLNFLKKGVFKQNEDYKTQNWEEKVEDLAQYTIKSIKRTGVKPVYNLTAGNTSTYLANGFITHNTGTNVDISTDAEKVLRDPEKYDFIGIDWDILEYKVPKEHITWKRRTFGWFVPAQISYEDGLKFNKMSFSDFIGVESEILDKVEFLDADWEHNSNLLLDKQAELLKTDRKEYQAYCVFLPTDPEHCFMSAQTNPFSPQKAKEHKVRLASEFDEIKGKARAITLRRDSKDESIIHYDLSNKKIAEFPHRGGFIDSPFLIYTEFPKTKPDRYRYIAGFDDYKFEQSNGDSIGAFYIFDRLTRKIVLSLASRPDPHKDLHRQIHMALDAYNAICFPENFDLEIKDYFDRLHVSDWYLAKSFDAFGDFKSFSSNRKYGWKPDKFNTPKVIGMVVDYVKEISDNKNEETGEIESYIIGVERVDDMMLLEEFINYKEGGNFDRIIALGSCLLYDYYLTTKYIVPKAEYRKRGVEETTKKEKPKPRNRFFTKSGRSKY